MINRATCGWIAIPCLTHTCLETQTSQTSRVTNFRLCERSSGSKRAWGLRRLTDLWKYLILEISDVTINFLCICLLYTCTHTCVYIYILFTIYNFSSNKPAKYHWNPMSAPAKVTLSPAFFEPSVGQIGLVKPWFLSRGVTFRFNPLNWRNPLHPWFPNPVL